MRKQAFSPVWIPALLLGLWNPTRGLADDVPLQCTTDRGSWTISATGPTLVPCPIEGSGQCSALEYHIVANGGRIPSHVAILVEHDDAVVVPPGEFVSQPCRGDRKTKLGARDCSRKSVRIDEDDEQDTQSFQIVVSGRKDVIASAIVVRKSGQTEHCRIASFGKDTFDQNEQVRITEQIAFKGCTVTIPTDPATGEGAPAEISGNNCVFVANAAPIGAGELVINGQSVGNLTFGDGSLSSGVSSCTTKVISRRLYTWCTCADLNGDGVPEDPKPPCPPILPD